jgi:hypothetical protein
MKPGRYTSVTSAEYHSVKWCTGSGGLEHVPASKSSLMKFSKCPFTWKKGEEFKRTPSMTMGSLVDCLCLEPEIFNTEFIMKPDKWDSFRKKEAREWRDARTAEGWSVITPKMLADAEQAKKNLLDNHLTGAAITMSDAQVAYVVDYKGIYVKGLFDMCPNLDSPYNDSIIDMKRTRARDHEQFEFDVMLFGYHVQAGNYLWLHEQATGEGRTGFHFVLSESNKPFNASLYTLSEEMIKQGTDRWFEWLEAYKYCCENNYWPEGPIWEDEKLKLRT